LSDAATGSILNTATIFLGLAVGATMTSEVFLNFQTIMIVVGGFLAQAPAIHDDEHHGALAGGHGLGSSGTAMFKLVADAGYDKRGIERLG
jgi:hypothetical protein